MLFIYIYIYIYIYTHIIITFRFAIMDLAVPDISFQFSGMAQSTPHTPRLRKRERGAATPPTFFVPRRKPVLSPVTSSLVKVIGEVH